MMVRNFLSAEYAFHSPCMVCFNSLVRLVGVEEKVRGRFCLHDTRTCALGKDEFEVKHW